MSTLIDIKGKKFNRLFVIRRENNAWICQCDCGNKAFVRSTWYLVHGIIKSCGCYNRESTSKRSKKHGMINTPEYVAWEHMLQRCYNPKDKAFKNYGGRGIKVCMKWRKSFESFYLAVGPRPSKKHWLERINNNLGYFGKNCKWALPAEQLINKRNNHRITFNDETLSIVQWSKRIGLHPEVIRSRIKRKWPLEKALNFYKHKNQYV